GLNTSTCNFIVILKTLIILLWCEGHQWAAFPLLCLSGSLYSRSLPHCIRTVEGHQIQDQSDHCDSAAHFCLLFKKVPFLPESCVKKLSCKEKDKPLNE
uniref:Uncharacterized protein n=1 Tax=Cyprinus carpio TaxID=7962 RepID=A0A8C1TQL8_CYPCA